MVLARDGAYISDVLHPYFGASERDLDAWIGYGRKRGETIRWRVPLSVKNIGETNRLIAVSTPPDGATETLRIAPLQTWRLTTGLEFR